VFQELLEAQQLEEETEIDEPEAGPSEPRGRRRKFGPTLKRASIRSVLERRLRQLLDNFKAEYLEDIRTQVGGRKRLKPTKTKAKKPTKKRRERREPKGKKKARQQ